MTGDGLEGTAGQGGDHGRARICRKFRFTDRGLRGLDRPPRGELEYRDTELRGFIVRVPVAGYPLGFGIRYSWRGRDRRLALGTMPPVTLAGARAEAARLLEALRLRNDEPRDRRRRAGQEALTLAELARKYVEAGGSRRGARREPIAQSTTTGYLRMVNAHLAKDTQVAGPAAMLTPEELEAYFEAVATDHGPAEANRLFQLARATCRWARRILRCNPCEGLQRPRGESSRERVLSNEEIAALWLATGEATLEEAAAASLAKWPRDKAREKKAARAREMRRQANACVRLQLLLGQRPTESAAARWPDLDIFPGHGRWMIPGEFRKSRRVNVVPLPPAPTRIFEALRPATASAQGRLFPLLSLHNVQRWWAPIVAHAMTEGAAHFTRNDLRRTCATGCASLGALPHVVSRILGHEQHWGQLAVTGIYDRFDRLPETAAALNAWAVHVERMVTCGQCGGAMRPGAGSLRCSACQWEQPRGADVVPFGR